MENPESDENESANNAEYNVESSDVDEPPIPETKKGNFQPIYLEPIECN